MTIFFNLENLEQTSGMDARKFMSLLKYHFEGKTMPKSKYEKHKPVPNLHGHSFLLNPEPLFAKSSIDPAYLVQYVILAGRRDYQTYKFHKIVSLDLSFFPDIDLSKISTNPLLKVVNNHIHFKYEELYGSSIR